MVHHRYLATPPLCRIAVMLPLMRECAPAKDMGDRLMRQLHLQDALLPATLPLAVACSIPTPSQNTDTSRSDIFAKSRVNPSYFKNTEFGNRAETVQHPRERRLDPGHPQRFKSGAALKDLALQGLLRDRAAVCLVKEDSS